MKKLILIFTLCLLCTGTRAQLKCNANGKLVTGSASITPNASYDWNINTYQGLNWVYRQGNNTRRLTVDLSGTDACLSSSFGHIKFYSLNPSTQAKSGYASAYCRYLYAQPTVEEEEPVMMAIGQDGSGGNRLLGTVATLARSVQTIQSRLLDHRSDVSTSGTARLNAAPTGGNAYLLVTTLDGQPIGKQAGTRPTAVDKTGLQAGTYRCTLLVDGQPAETTLFVVTDF